MSSSLSHLDHSTNGHSERPLPQSSASVPDPFDPAQLKLSQDFTSMANVEDLHLTVPVRKPAGEWWIRVHPDEKYRLQTPVLELKESQELFLVKKALWPELASEATFSPRLLITAMNRQSVLFIWPIRLPGADGRIDRWSQSAHSAARVAVEKWVRISSNTSLGAYTVNAAPVEHAAPNWPDISFRDILERAFSGRSIESLDHPVLRTLRGEV